MMALSGPSSASLSVVPAARGIVIAHAGGQFAGQIFRRDDFVATEQHATFDDILQFAYITGPAVSLQNLDGFGDQSRELACPLLR